MAISDSQKIDYLWKKIGFGATKTDLPEYKRGYNESISSPLLVRGDRIWQRSAEIPVLIPSVSTDIIAIYKDGDGVGHDLTVECDLDNTSSENRTWITNLKDWIPPEFGPTYLVKVYVDDAAAASPETTGVSLPITGSGNNDEWFFDYQSGVLHFIGENLPLSISEGITDKKIYVSGARYVGTFGSGATPGQQAYIGNLEVVGTTISTLDPNDNLVFDAVGPGLISFNSNPLTDVADPTDPQDAATKNYVDTSFENFDDDRIVKTDSSVIVTDDRVTVTINGTETSYFDSTGYVSGNLTFGGGKISSTDTIELDSTSAINLPSGTTQQRPTDPNPGDMRFNTTSMSVEFYDGGAWINVINHISSELLYPDGVTTEFELSQEASADSVIITLNGVVQSTIAYQISGNMITFNEPPKPEDLIDIRYLATSISTRLASKHAPPSSTSPGYPGEVAYDDNYIYVCTDVNTWVRAPISTW